MSHSKSRQSKLLYAGLLALAVAGIAWALVGIAAALTHRSVPWWYWLPLVVALPTALMLWLPTQDFAPQPWEARIRETGTLFGFSGGIGWGVWFIAGGGVPFMLWGLLVGPPAYSRLGSAIGLGICLGGVLVGLKLLDARIARRELEHDHRRDADE